MNTINLPFKSFWSTILAWTFGSAEGGVINRQAISQTCKNTNGIDLIEEAIRAYYNSDYQKSFSILMKNPELVQANADALFILANMYMFGNGISKNVKAAIELYFKATELGCKDAMYNIGVSYLKGIGHKKNYEMGISWIQKAAEKGEEKSMLFIANQCQDEGRLSEAKGWLERLASYGNPQGMYQLAVMYLNGISGQVNYAYSLALLNKVIDREITDTSLKPIQKSLNLLGIMHAQGLGVRIDVHKAVVYLKLSYQLGDKTASSLLKKWAVL
ncbi:MAG: sel1 repeat family protein [Saprospiraceae bacterium]|nr:sel1 repeat family protein [Saprospiraceae bacterium]